MEKVGHMMNHGPTSRHPLTSKTKMNAFLLIKELSIEVRNTRTSNKKGETSRSPRFFATTLLALCAFRFLDLSDWRSREDGKFKLSG